MLPNLYIFFIAFRALDSTLSMFTGPSGKRSSSSLHLDPADINRVSAEAKRIATEEALATRSPVIHATPSSRDFSLPAPGDRPTKSDSLHPEISIVHDPTTDRPASGSYGAAAPRWDSNGFPKLLPSGDGPGNHASAAPCAAPPHTAAPPALSSF